ncbi:MAG: hypothetical protein HKP09_08045 [Enterobacterales bacterium]|nr:hypothetical protein [Enterobacterales bacterium]
MTDFFTELKRRNVVKVAIAYMALGWVVIQVTDVAVPALNLPESLNSIVVYLGIIGLPFALFFAWAFELTPDGVVRTEDVSIEQSITNQTSQKINYLIIALLSFSVIWLLYDKEIAPTKSLTDDEMPSIAVLAFADFSPNQDQEYFADGISDEILNLLVKTQGMTVTGRTSSFAFKGKDDKIPAIAEKLNVDHVLEGSISKSNNRIKVTAQLNDANGVHLWSETYIRELTDIFDIQEEIAAEITNTLAASVGVQIKTAKVTRTDSIEAYEQYFKGRELFIKRGLQNLRQASLLFQQALAIDPNYAPAWRDLASVYSVMESYDINSPDEEVALWRSTGIAAVKKAIELTPGDAESHATKSAFHTYSFDMSNGMDEVIKAIQLSPNNPHVLDLAAQTFIELGYFKRAEEFSKKAVELDPLVSIYRITLCRLLFTQGKFEEGLEQAQKAILIDPQMRFAYAQIIQEYILKKDITKVREYFEMSQAAGVSLVLNKLQIDLIEDALDKGTMSSTNDMHPFIKWSVAQAIGNIELQNAIASDLWGDKFRSNTFLFERIGSAANTERWKQEVRDLNIYEVWLKHGFPEHCRSINSDDFECSSFMADINSD